MSAIRGRRRCHKKSGKKGVGGEGGGSGELNEGGASWSLVK